MNALKLEDGTAIRAPHHAECDFVVVGSGPAGAAAARVLARGGARVIVVEEGPYVPPEHFPEDAFGAMALMYREMGASVLMGRVPMPYIQGRVVGGTSVINGSISWRLPRSVYDGWVAGDAALADAVPWTALEAVTDEVERDLNIAPTADDIAGPKNLLMHRGAEALGLEHRPISRNVRGCRGLGRCLQGCPEGHKLSMERSYLVDASAAGAVILHSVTVTGVDVAGERATGITGKSAGGATVQIRAKRGVVLAASAVQTPALLQRSGIRHGPVGQGFQCHPGASVTGFWKEPVCMWTGATQGHEVIGLRQEGLKFEVLGFDLAMVASRIKGVGSAFSAGLERMAHAVNWGVAVRAAARGRVKPGWGGRASVTMDLHRDDVAKVRRGVRIMGEMMLAAGAQKVTPGVHGWHAEVADRAVMARFEEEGPLDGRAYPMAVTHMFGTCRMGADRARSVVDLRGAHHHVAALHVVDSSVFPSNTGVNPQTSILALSTLLARGMAG
ncbi:MAG: GMC family oxidoreductase [Deltaproteobacteria bacterium]|nr:GMC family oxidoreductase [Deltaproteobacteria bacterium]